MRNRCTLIPVIPTMSARAIRSKSSSSTLSSTNVTRCSFGVRAASNGKLAGGTLARLPNSGNACSSPQYDVSKAGLMSTMSAMIDLNFRKAEG